MGLYLSKCSFVQQFAMTLTQSHLTSITTFDEGDPLKKPGSFHIRASDIIVTGKKKSA